MSISLISGALETALAAISPAIATAWENLNFTPPVASIPYQEVNVLYATPDNKEYGANRIELGYMQVKLMYPLNAGKGAASTRAELIRTTFKRGNSFTSGTSVTTVTQTPSINIIGVELDRFAVIVKIPFHSHQGA